MDSSNVEWHPQRAYIQLVDQWFLALANDVRRCVRFKCFVFVTKPRVFQCFLTEERIGEAIGDKTSLVVVTRCYAGRFASAGDRLHPFHSGNPSPSPARSAWRCARRTNRGWPSTSGCPSQSWESRPIGRSSTRPRPGERRSNYISLSRSPSFRLTAYPVA